MQNERFHKSNPSFSYLENSSKQAEYLYKQILNPRNRGYKIPKAGISTEILTYIAFKENGIPIKYSSYENDTKKHFDFSVTEKDIHVDTTCSNSAKNYLKKYVNGKVLVLYIPFGNKETISDFKNSRLCSHKESYIYNLLKHNRFNTRDFLYHTLDINYEILYVLRENSFREEGRYDTRKILVGLQELLITQLHDAINSIDSPLDNI